MTVSWMTAYRAFLLLSLVVGSFLLYQATVHRDRPGAKPLLLLVSGSLLYVSVKLTVSLVRETSTVFVITRFNPLGAGLAAAGFFLLVVEYTGVENPVSKRTAAGVVFVPAVISTLAWIDLEYLWVPVSEDASTLTGYAWEFTSVALLNQLYMNLLLFAGIGLLVRRETPSSDLFTMQVGALVLAALGPVLGNLGFQLGYLPFNLAPVMFVASGALVAWAILRAGFLDLVPIGRETVLAQFDAGVVTLDRDHRVIDINERGRRLFDVGKADTVVGDHVDALFADRPSFGELYWSVTTGDAERDSLVEYDGGYYTVDVIPLGQSGETPLGRAIVIRDITDRKRREQKLEALTTRFELALEETDTGVWQWEFETDELLWDETIKRLFGYAPGEFPGTFEGFADRVPEEDLETVREKLRTAIETEEEYRADFRVCPPDDEQRWVHARGVVKSNESGEPVRMIGIQTDITEQKEYERELEEAKRTLEQSNEKLDQFARTVSHDLRNPLSVAKGHLELMEAETESEHLHTVKEAHERMESLIDDLLTLARQGEVIEDPEPVDLATLAEATWRNVTTAEATLKIETERTIRADTSRLQELLENLFRNAVAHAGEDVTVTVGDVADGFHVADDGPGITAEKRSDVFEAGYSTGDGGTGFGLSIVREIAEAHGWKVSITESGTGGARFEITGVETGG